VRGRRYYGLLIDGRDDPLNELAVAVRPPRHDQAVKQINIALGIMLLAVSARAQA
jgi:hypothetical protein